MPTGSRVLAVSTESDDFIIQRTSTSDQVARALRTRILRGDLAPGTPLREVALAATLGVSRNTVREGIRVLVAEGLLTHNVHRGVTVTALTANDVRDIYQVRSVLESAGALRFDARNGDDLREMQRTIKELDRAVRADDRLAIVELDFRFHSQLVDSLNSPRLSAFYSNTLAELRLALFVLDREESQWRDWLVHHREILEALGNGRRRESVKLVERHLREAEARLLRIVDGRQTATASDSRGVEPAQ
jgi:DNA-binding GntR family transcriptional regulator